MASTRLDAIDRMILAELQADGRMTNVELAKRVGISAPPCLRRVRTLEENGYIKGYHAEVNAKELGFEVQVSLRVTLDKTEPSAFDEFLKAARKIKEVLEIQTFLGLVDVRLSVVARDMEHYQQVYRDSILVLPHISDIEALMHISTIKLDRRLPI